MSFRETAKAVREALAEQLGPVEEKPKKTTKKSTKTPKKSTDKGNDE
jgi:hypothetical protein